jgi:hypothetical protein
MIHIDIVKDACHLSSLLYIGCIGVHQHTSTPYTKTQAVVSFEQMKRKLAFISVLLGLALIGVVALKAKPTKTANAAAGWRFVTNQDGSLGLPARPWGLKFLASRPELSG